MAQGLRKEEWKCVIEVNGELYVRVDLIKVMRVLSARVWDILHQVCMSKKLM